MEKNRKIFYMLTLVLFSFLLFFFIFMCFAGEKNKQLVKITSRPKIETDNVFKKGESLIFGVYSRGIKVGSGKLVYHGIETINGLDLQHITFSASTFSVKDEDDVYGTLDFSSPVVVRRNVRVFGRQENIVEQYSPDRKTVRISKTINGVIQPEATLVSKEPMTNVLLLVYALRNEKNLHEGSLFRIVLPTQAFDLKARALRKIRVPKGIFNTHYFESTPSKYKLWLDSGKEKLPARIQGLAAGGMMYLALINVS